MIGRRGFLAGILAAGVAPAIVHSPMKIFVPKKDIEVVESIIYDTGFPDPRNWLNTVPYVRRQIFPGLIDAPQGFALIEHNRSEFLKSMSQIYGVDLSPRIPRLIPKHDPSTPLEWMSFETGHHPGGMFA